MQQAFLIRHGETEWSLNGRHTGWTDIPLTDHGREVARRLAIPLAQEAFDLVLTSPLQRARDTCEIAGLGSQARIEPSLAEWDYGDYEGLTLAQIQELAPDWIIFRDGCPGGESAAQICARVDEVIVRVREYMGNVAIFAHGHLLRVFVARWLGWPAAAGCHFLLDTATLNILDYYRGIPAINCWNAPISRE